METVITTIAEPILSEVEENLMVLIKRHVRYLFCLESIVEDLNEEYQKLESAHGRIKYEKSVAKRNTEEIEEDVEKWLEEVRQALEDVKKLKEEIEGNETCFSGWCPNWVCGYQLSRKAEQKRSHMLKLRENGKFSKISHPAKLPGIEFLAPTDFELFMSSKYVYDQIIDALKDDKINKVGLYGMGGVGKTTLAKSVGIEVNKGIFDEVVMVIISQTPNFQKIQDELAMQLGLKFQKDDELERAKQLYLRFTDTENKILVILDDVWEEFDLKEKIGIPSNKDHKGCKVLLTTRSEQVCIDMNCQQKIQLNILNEEEGLTLLKKYAGIVDDDSILNDVAIDVAGECSGLPLALGIIGRALKGKSINHWHLVSRELKDSKLEDGPLNVSGERGIYGCLKLSYNNLVGEKRKLCFLLCSLFPKDSEISVEDLVKFSIGLDLFKDTRSVENVRIELLSIIDELKRSCLLLDTGDEEFVKMHDVVHDVALWIASKGEHVFMSKTGMELTEWSNEEGWDQYTAISCLNNKIEELHVGLACPNLNVLLLGCEPGEGMLKVSDECFKKMKALKVAALLGVDLSLTSLQFLKNLKTLELLFCNLRDISSLSKLNNLEILSFNSSWFNELPRELSELRKLRMFDLRDCAQLERIPSNFLPNFTQLEELYIGDSFIDWEIEETIAETSNAGFFELISLSRLVVLSLQINAKHLPKDFDSLCHKLLRYDISVNTSISRSRKNALKIEDIETDSIIAFEGLYQTLAYLCLKKVKGCQNIFPTIDQGGLPLLSKGPTHHVNLKRLTDVEVIECNNLIYLFTLSLARSLVQLKSLRVRDCESLKHLVMTEEGDNDEGEFEASSHEIVLPKLKILSLERLTNLIRFCNENYDLTCPVLEDFTINQCPNLSTFIAKVQNVQEVKAMKVSDCKSLENLFLTKEGDKGKEVEILPKSDHEAVSLSSLRIKNLPQLRCIWKGPTHNLNLQSLTNVRVNECESLNCLFTLSIARSLVQLESLIVSCCVSLEFLVMTEDCDDRRGEEILPKLDIVLPKLNFLKLEGLPNLIKFCPESYHLKLPTLEVFEIEGCYRFNMSFNDDLVAEKLRRLSISGCKQSYDILVSGLRDGFFTNLEELSINYCSIKVLFHVESLLIDGQQQILSLPNLKTLSLNHVLELEGLWQGPTHLLSMENLTMLCIYNCNRLRNIFSPSLARNLLQLEELYISDCGELEEIIVEDDEEYRTLEEDYPKPLLFQNLSRIEVERCPKLRHLFPITIARGFQRLFLINVIDNSQLEEVFGEKEAYDVRDQKEIVLPQLDWLLLDGLPSLTNFCPVGYHFIFPHLESRLTVEECPKINTRFSVAQDKSVYVEAKPQKIGKENESAEFRSIQMNRWFDPDSPGLEEILPPYIENNVQSISQQK